MDDESGERMGRCIQLCYVIISFYFVSPDGLDTGPTTPRLRRIEGGEGRGGGGGKVTGCIRLGPATSGSRFYVLAVS